MASGGTSNLNSGTLKSIGMAWILTLPVAMLLGMLFFVIFHLFI
jgi:PiT family inorganic phosphate transporter